MSARQRWMLYGATGYTGSHIAAAAVAKGYRPLLVGRDAKKLEAVAAPLGLEWRAVDLHDSTALRQLTAECSAVMLAAGPFAGTYAPMLDACLATGTHYLDITGEVPVFEAIAARDHEARAAGIMLLPGCGFDMVPGDCLAQYLKRRLPDATSLEVGMSFSGTLTRGTIRSALAAVEPLAQVRRGHRLVSLQAPQMKSFDFGPGNHGGNADCYAATFGDISVAWRSTGIPDVTSYLRPAQEFAALAALPNLAAIDSLPDGPSDEELATIPSHFVAVASNAAGTRVAARLTTPQVYAITSVLAADIAQRVHEGAVRSGFQTPAPLFGEDFILGFANCRREEISAP